MKYEERMVCCILIEKIGNFQRYELQIDLHNILTHGIAEIENDKKKLQQQRSFKIYMTSFQFIRHLQKIYFKVEEKHLWNIVPHSILQNHLFSRSFHFHAEIAKI